MIKSQLFIIFLVSISTCIYSQRTSSVVKTEDNIKIDGVLDEASWKLPKPADNFWQYFPSDSVPAVHQTEIYFLYDEKNLYIGIKCYSPGNNYVIPSLMRDFRAGGNDNITLMIDPFNDRINAFLFGTNPMGVQREGLVSGGGEDLENFTLSWDNKWKNESKIFDGYWSSEMEIPISILRFNPGVDKWSFNSYRFDTQSNERSSWNQIPRNQWIFNLAFMGEMVWDEALQKTSGGKNSIIPYATAGVSKDFENSKPSSSFYNFGGDAKIAVSPSLNLDLTFNPDFSQVEVDQQVTNVDRFEIFFPERRQFFLENADLFGSFGQTRINPFFSRRIGVNIDTTSGNAVQNTIYAGARLSGKLNENLRIGLLSMQTAADVENGLPDYNYSIVSLQRKMFSRSNLGIIFVNKQAFNFEDNGSENDKFNRVIGLDYNLATNDNTWTGKAFIHRSFSVNSLNMPYAQGSTLRYNTRRFFLLWDQQFVGEGFDAQVGYVPRTNFIGLNPSLGMKFYQKDGLFNVHGPTLEFKYLLTPEIGNTDYSLAFKYEAELKNNARLNGEIENTYVYLTADFDPTGSDSEALKAFTAYNYNAIKLSFMSNTNLNFTYRIQPTIGEYFNGYRAGAFGNIAYRFQPYGQISFEYGYNYFSLPHLNSFRQTVILSPRLDLTFNKKLFLSTVVQYNSQIANMNVNARLQWRFAPVSDFYLVFTDNYFSDFANDPSNRFMTEIRNRSLVAKVTYWLNI